MSAPAAPPVAPPSAAATSPVGAQAVVPVLGTPGAAAPIPPPITPTPTAKTSAKQQMFDRMRDAKYLKPAGGDKPVADPPVAKPAPAKPAEPAKPEPKVDDEFDDVEATPGEVAKPVEKATTDPAKPGEKQKVNPWKLLEETKAARAKAEQELAEFRKLVPDEAARKAEIDEFQATKQRAKELEDHIRFVDYSKSQEFQDKYQKPYEQAWQKAMKQLTQITIEGDDGVPRRVTSTDLHQIVSMELGDAQEAAEAKFGKFAPVVMMHREKIQDLFDQQATALEEAKKNGEQRVKQRTEEWMRTQGEVRRQITDAWAKADEAARKDERVGKYFQQREGDAEWNMRLGKGYEIADRAMSENPTDPRYTPEQRLSAIKRHVALRHRAAAFGPVAYENAQLKTELAKVKKELEQFKGSVPVTKGGEPTPASQEPSSPKAAMLQRLYKLAK